MDGNLALSAQIVFCCSPILSLASARSEDAGVQTPTTAERGREEGQALPLFSPLYSIPFRRDLPSISSGLERVVAAAGLDCTLPWPVLTLAQAAGRALQLEARCQSLAGQRA